MPRSDLNKRAKVWTRETAIAYLNDTYHTLNAQSDLSPDNPLVSRILHRLVATLSAWHDDGFGADLREAPQLKDARTGLPRLCAIAEQDLEKWWCRKALASRAPGRAVEQFWYLSNYRSLCRAETLLAGRDTLREAIFLGSGALPLTAILLAQHDERASLRCVDADMQACELATALVRALGLDKRIRIEHARAEHCNIPAKATVICASLLDAPGLQVHLAQCGVRHLLVRDAEGVYQWLYRPAPRQGPAFRERARTALSTQRINITRYLVAADRIGTQRTRGADGRDHRQRMVDPWAKAAD